MRDGLASNLERRLLRSETAAGIAAVGAGLTIATRRVDADRLIPKDGLDFATGADVGAERAIRAALRPLYAGSPESLGSLIAAIVRSERWFLRQFGTALAFARLAAGDIGGLLLLGEVPSPLHTAAGCLLAEEAGAVVTDLAGRPWNLSTTAFVVGATTMLHAELLAMSVASFAPARS